MCIRDRNSINIILAFIRWKEFGNKSWNYPDADFDAYLITTWTEDVYKRQDLSVSWDFLIIDEVHKYLFIKDTYETMHSLSAKSRCV